MVYAKQDYRGGQRLGAVVGCVEMHVSNGSQCLGGGGSRQAIPWVRKLRGWLLPLEATALATAPWILGINSPLGPASGKGQAWGRLLWGLQDEMNRRGSPGSVGGTGNPQRSRAWGPRWCITATRAFTPDGASSLLGWSPPGRPSEIQPEAAETSDPPG